MPVVAVKGAIIVVSVAVAAAIAVYESPQARQFAEDVRRRIAVALHSLGDEINPNARQPRFNRPEDAEGFLRSQGTAEPGVDADEESKRRQREELMYWNAVHLEKMEREKKDLAKRPENKSRGSSFDDFLQPEHGAEKGTFVYNTGASANPAPEEGLRQRGVRGLNRGSVYANPFSDEHNIELEEQQADAGLLSPEEHERLETFSNLYSATDYPHREVASSSSTLSQQPLIDVSPNPIPDPPISYPTMDDPLLAESTNYATMAGPSSEAHNEHSPFASIHAWADQANNSFYAPLPVTPGNVTPRELEPPTPLSPTFSDPDVSVPGSGAATPTYSASIAGSAAEEVWAPRSGATSEAGVESIDGDGISTPGTWTEVGSVVSENDVGAGIVH